MSDDLNKYNKTGYIAAVARGHNAGVCLLKDGKIVFSIEETFNITIPFNANDPTNSTFDISNVSSIISAVENLVNSASGKN